MTAGEPAVVARSIRLRAYANRRGGEYAVQDKARQDHDGITRMYWVPSYRPLGGKWRKIPGSAWYNHLNAAQLALDIYARAHGLSELPR